MARRSVNHTPQYYISRIIGFALEHGPDYVYRRLRDMLEEDKGLDRVGCECCEKRIDREKAVYGGGDDGLYFCQTCAAGLMSDSDEEQETVHGS
jgi:hypothetical protein